MDINKAALIGLVGVVASYALSNKVSEIQSRIIIGDIGIDDVDFKLSSIIMEMSMPVKNASSSNLSFDGFVGYLDFKGHKIADITILDTVQLTSGQVVKIPVKATIWYTTVISEVVALWDDLKQILTTRKFNGEMFIKGVVYSGALSFNTSNRIF